MKELPPKELKAHIDEADIPPILVDVREPWEYEIAHLPGAILIPLDVLPTQLDKLKRDAELVVVCHHGIRSRAAAFYLERHGFKKVINLKGGVDAWANEVDHEMATYR